MPLAFGASVPVRLLRNARRLKTPRCSTSMSTLSVPLSDSLDVHVVPILFSNFSYLIHDKINRSAALVDPAEPEKLLDVANTLSANVTSSLTTHHHWDHAGGNADLARLVPDIEIVGSSYETADAITVPLKSGAKHSLKGTSLTVSALRTPCHTQGHLCFTTDTAQKAVFTGDTLFVGGCGKFFEGNAQDMQTSLNEVLAKLDDDTLVFCGHEYTVSNLLFASSVDPENPAVVEKLAWARAQVQNGVPTVPSTIRSEKSFNPFMRTNIPVIAHAVGADGDDPTSVMKLLREKKNAFRS